MAVSKIFVIIDPTTDLQPAFERGLDSARDTGATLHLYACANEDSGCASPEDARSKVQPVLDALAARLKKRAVRPALKWSGPLTGQSRLSRLLRAAARP